MRISPVGSLTQAWSYRVFDMTGEKLGKKPNLRTTELLMTMSSNVTVGAPEQAIVSAPWAQGPAVCLFFSSQGLVSQNPRGILLEADGPIWPFHHFNALISYFFAFSSF